MKSVAIYLFLCLQTLTLSYDDGQWRGQGLEASKYRHKGSYWRYAAPSYKAADTSSSLTTPEIIQVQSISNITTTEIPTQQAVTEEDVINVNNIEKIQNDEAQSAVYSAALALANRAYYTPTARESTPLQEDTVISHENVTASNEAVEIPNNNGTNLISEKKNISPDLGLNSKESNNKTRLHETVTTYSHIISTATPRDLSAKDSQNSSLWDLNKYGFQPHSVHTYGTAADNVQPETPTQATVPRQQVLAKSIDNNVTTTVLDGNKTISSKMPSLDVLKKSHKHSASKSHHHYNISSHPHKGISSKTFHRHVVPINQSIFNIAENTSKLFQIATEPPTKSIANNASHSDIPNVTKHNTTNTMPSTPSIYRNYVTSPFQRFFYRSVLPLDISEVNNAKDYRMPLQGNYYFPIYQSAYMFSPPGMLGQYEIIKNGDYKTTMLNSVSTTIQATTPTSTTTIQPPNILVTATQIPNIIMSTTQTTDKLSPVESSDVPPPTLSLNYQPSTTPTINYTLPLVDGANTEMTAIQMPNQS